VVAEHTKVGILPFLLARRDGLAVRLQRENASRLLMIVIIIEARAIAINNKYYIIIMETLNARPHSVSAVIW